MKKIKMFAAAAIFCAAGFAGYAAYEQATMTDQEKLFQANLEALTRHEDTEEYMKLTVCLCTDVSPENGYYDFADMKNHCHEGIGNDCEGRVYNCQYTWYCNL